MKISKINLLLIGLIGIHLFLLINLQFTAWPEMSSFPYLVSKGFTLYKDFVHVYPPLLTLILTAIYNLFGYKLIILKLFTWLLIIINDIFIFLIVKKIAKSLAPAFLAIVFHILTQPFLEGNMLWFDTALVTPVLIGTYFAIRDFMDVRKTGKNLFISGIFFAIAMLIKQTAVVYIASLVLLLMFHQKKFKDVVMFLTPILFSAAILVIWLLFTKSLIDFYNWNFYYTTKYWTSFPGYVRMGLTGGEIKTLLLILLPAFALFLHKYKEILSNRSLFAPYLFLISGIVAVYPRFSFFHFQLALAFCALIFGIYYFKLKPQLYLIIPYILALLIVVSVPSVKINWTKETRFWNSEELKLAELISKKTEGNSSYLLGPHSGLYLFADIVPPKPWLENFGWYFEIPGVQESTIESWETNPPDAIFIQDPSLGNWFDTGTYQPKQILTWIETNYTKKGEVVPGIWCWELKNR